MVKVIVNEDCCKGCGLCVRACPVNIMTLDSARINIKGFYPATCIDISKCISCAMCARMCPDVCITVER